MRDITWVEINQWFIDRAASLRHLEKTEAKMRIEEILFFRDHLKELSEKEKPR